MIRPKIKVEMLAAVIPFTREKTKLNEKEAESREDWEGGASRPTNENVPAQALPKDSPAKNLQRQAESVLKTSYGDKGPPKNLQSLPTQNTNEVSVEDEVKNKRGQRHV